MIRLSPPSTGIRYTRSALDSPVAGRSGTVLPIFTISTRRSDLTLSPVNGDRGGAAGDAETGGDAGGGGRCGILAAPPERRRTLPAAIPPAATAPTAATPMLC